MAQRHDSRHGRLNRRDLIRRSAMAGAGIAAVPLIRSRGFSSVAAQDDIPRTPSTAKVDGTLQVLLAADFHPDHNAFMTSEIEAYAAASGWQVEVTDVAGYQGGGDLFQKILGGVQAGNAPDVLIHNVGVRNMQTLGLCQAVTDLVTEFAGMYGEPIGGAKLDSFLDEEWYATPFFTRANGHYVRRDIFEAAGLDVDADTETYDKMRDAALKVSDAANNVWGWGMTVNRSGDGNGLVQNVIFRYGGHLQDETGQKVTFNSPETIAGLTWLKDIYTAEQYQPMLPPGILSWTDPSNNEAFLAGQIAITQNAGTVLAKAILDQVPFVDNISYIRYPTRISDGARLDALTGGAKFFVITDTKNKDAVYDLNRHFMTLPVQQRIWSISAAYALPAYTNGWDDPIITENKNSMVAKDIGLNQTDFTGLQWPGPLNEAVGSIGEQTFFTDLMSEILQGRAVEEVVSDYHDKFVQIYQDFGLDGE